MEKNWGDTPSATLSYNAIFPFSKKHFKLINEIHT